MIAIHPLDDPDTKRRSCEALTVLLPDYFGIEKANRQYAEQAQLLPALAAYDSDKNIVGLLLYRHKTRATKIHWMAVHPDFHRQGIGRALITLLEKIVKEKGDDTLSVETLDPMVRDPHYLQTYAFYKALSFKTAHHFSYDDGNMMVAMTKSV